MASTRSSSLDPKESNPSFWRKYWKWIAAPFVIGAIVTISIFTLGIPAIIAIAVTIGSSMTLSGTGALVAGTVTLGVGTLLTSFIAVNIGNVVRGIWSGLKWIGNKIWGKPAVIENTEPPKPTEEKKEETITEEAKESPALESTLSQRRSSLSHSVIIESTLNSPRRKSSVSHMEDEDDPKKRLEKTKQLSLPKTPDLPTKGKSPFEILAPNFDAKVETHLTYIDEMVKAFRARNVNAFWNHDTQIGATYTIKKSTDIFTNLDDFNQFKYEPNTIVFQKNKEDQWTCIKIEENYNKKMITLSSNDIDYLNSHEFAKENVQNAYEKLPSLKTSQLQPAKAEYNNILENVRYHVASTIVEEKNIDERTFIMERWIVIMDRCFQSNDYGSAYQIYLGLNNAPQNLNITKQGLSQPAKNALETASKYFTKSGENSIHDQYKEQKNVIPHFIGDLEKYTFARIPGIKKAQSDFQNALKQLFHYSYEIKKIDNLFSTIDSRDKQKNRKRWEAEQKLIYKINNMIAENDSLLGAEDKKTIEHCLKTKNAFDKLKKDNSIPVNYTAPITQQLIYRTIMNEYSLSPNNSHEKWEPKDIPITSFDELYRTAKSYLENNKDLTIRPNISKKSASKGGKLWTKPESTKKLKR